jgi:hypothetical protein
MQASERTAEHRIGRLRLDQRGGLLTGVAASGFPI